MIINSSAVSMAGTRSYSSSRTDAYSSSMVSGDQLSAMNGVQNTGGFADLLGGLAKREESEDEPIPSSNYSGLKNFVDKVSNVGNRDESSLSERDNMKIKFQTINYLLWLLFYHKKAGKIEDESDVSDYIAKQEEMNFASPGAMYSVMHHESSYVETEQMAFSTQGTVRTADGREISFNVDVSMSRRFESYVSNDVITNMSLIDPLVINLDSNPASVSDQKFYFDLDSDGQLDEMSSLGAGSAFLAIDLDNNGQIDNGSELFGTKSGDGFKDLARYDIDGNGWIDEADDVFDKLKLFAVNPDGSTSLFTLKEKGIGALCLSHVATGFNINDNDNNTLGAIRQSGVFLNENGSVGTMQHVDLALKRASIA